MAGYRDFQTGEVLTAANVNDFLMEQSVMTFADATARTTALTDVLREGLLTYNLDTNRLEVYDGSAWVEPAPEPPAGIGSNVVQTVKTDTFSMTGNTFAVVTDLTATITPSSNTSKVLVLYTLMAMSNGNIASFATRLMRGVTPIYIGDAEGDRKRASTTRTASPINVANNSVGPVSGMFLDSPATDSAVTYSVEISSDGGGSVFVNRNETDTDGTAFARGASSLIVIEVAA